jgi:hypothetical protein
MKTMIAIPLLCLAMNAAASCPVAHPRVPPEIPNAAVAIERDMQRAQLAAEKYLLQGETYLECGLMNRRQYNQLLTQMEQFYDRYNDEMVEYQTRNRMVAEVDRVPAAPAAETSAK